MLRSARLGSLARLGACLLGALLLSAPLASADSGCVDSTDAQIYTLIDSLRTAGAAISIDGSDSDWALFPSFADPDDDLVGNPGQEIVAGSIAPLSDRVKLLARTAGTPPQTAGAFGVGLDLLNGPSLDVQIILVPPTGPHTVILYDSQNQPILPPAGTISGSALQIGFGSSFVEVEVPYSVLTSFLPDLALPDQRSWVRGGLGSASGGAPLDLPPGASSYRLIPTPYDLDPPLPANPNAPRTLTLPLHGQWFVTQGAFGDFSHQTYWAYDFNQVDHSFNRSSPPNSTSNPDYFAFGEPIYAPAAGVVTSVVEGNPDVPPLNPIAAPFNIVALALGGGLTVSMLHEKQNSVIVPFPVAVAEGDQLAQVGNSGYTTSPHLHVEINETGGPLGASVRGVELTDVRVSLNPVANDPWRRECSDWEIREGFLVESLPEPAIPVLTAAEHQKLVASDGSGADHFGYASAAFGDTAVMGAYQDDVGANTDQGSAYVYQRGPAGSFTQLQKLTASDGAPSDFFGISVGVWDDLVVAGSYNDQVGANAAQGSAYVYRWNGSSWVQEQKLTASDGAAGDQFGTDLAVAGDRVVVGAWADDVGANADQGSAYVFRWNGLSWVQEQKLTASDGAAGDAFGLSVAISSDRIVVGAYTDDVGANADQGSAYVFRWNGSSWVQEQKLTAVDGAASDLFGDSVSVSADVVAVGAYEDDGAVANQGSAYVFRWNGSSFAQEQKLTASDGAASTLPRYGVSVAVSGDVLAVGAYRDDPGGTNNRGAAYFYRFDGTSWTGEKKRLASDGLADDNFGISVSLSSDIAVVGAYLDDVGANTNQGSAYVFSLLDETKLVAADGKDYDVFGQSVSVSGGVVLIGAPFYNFGPTDRGSAYVFRWNGSSWVQEQKLTALDGAVVDQFGWSVAVSGDVAFVGANQDDVGANPNQGSAYVFRWNGSSWMQEQKLTAADGAAQDAFGQSISVSGDVALLGASNTNSGQGSAYVFRWNGSSWVQEQKLTASDGAGGDYFGVSVAISGDVAVVGAHVDNNGANVDQGSAYIFRWNGSSWVQEQKLTAADGAANDLFGCSVSTRSEDSLLIGALGDDVGANAAQGSAYAFGWNGSSWVQQQKLTAADGAPIDQFGVSVSASGSVALVGASGDDEMGGGYVFQWTGSSWLQQQKLVASDGANAFGISASVSSDVAVFGDYLDDVGANGTPQGSASAFTLPATDSDGDGLFEPRESLLATDALDPDSDDDGLADGAEVDVHGTLPLDADTENDGLNDGAEVAQGTDPFDPDSDNDGLTDGAEVNTHGTNPLVVDTDGDYYSDGAEIQAGTDPLNPASHPAIPVPSLSPPALGLLAALLLAGAAGIAARRRRGDPPISS